MAKRASKTVSKAENKKPDPVAEKLPGGVVETFKARPNKKGVYLLSDGVWFWREFQASKYIKNNEGVTMKFVKNPHYGEE